MKIIIIYKVMQKLGVWVVDISVLIYYNDWLENVLPI